MSHGRDVHDRRRRVLYSAHQAEHTPAPSRREAERMREARRPQAVYGERVERRLQGRWFSLVPVRRRTMALVAGLIAAIAMALCAAHYVAVAWPSIANRPEIARPLRLDRPDSFGRWFTGAMLVTSAGVALLIYQLRRYRLDDYHGRYRLWRLVLLILVLASMNSLVGLIDWSGALLDAGFGKRVALSGSDWIRLVLSFSGAIFAIRLAIEVHRCRLALLSVLLAFGLLAIPEAANWHVLKVETIGNWLLVTSAPLLAMAALLIGLGSYLRLLYREVLDLPEPESMRERFQQLCHQLSVRLDQIATKTEPDEDEEEEQPKSKGWLRRSKEDKRKASRVESKREKPKRRSADETKPAKKRGWFGSRSEKADQPKREQVQDSEDAPAKEPRKKSRRFSMRLAPPSTDQNTSGADSKSSSDSTSAATKSRKSGIGGWLRRDSGSQTDQAETKKSVSRSESKSKPAVKAAEARQPEQELDEADTGNIDWSSMSKAERRRLRKQLKRRGRAA